jgi:heparin binding hemagglutinin HbhA
MAKKTSKNENTIEDLKTPLLAAVGAADLALATVNEIVTTLRERAEVAGDRMDDRRAALTRLQGQLPKRTEELRGRLSTEELRKAADDFLVDATETYNSLVARGEAALERLKGQPEFKDAADRVEGYVDQAVELTQEALGNVSAQTRAVGERAAKLVGVELPAKATLSKITSAASATSATLATPVRVTPAKAPAKAPAKKATPVRTVAKKAAPAKAVVKKVVKKAPAKKGPAKKVTQK